ncbi:MAG: ParB/RepB/Spo0J family partition protein [Bacteroidetes bacterium]|nr:ParB/RepB/Spo0J family partition protein [Bacteroidota bacterium]
MKGKKKALGRGLSALLESPDTDITFKDMSGNYVVGAIATISISSIESNPFQPRSQFEEEALDELMNSIKQQGLIQPVTVRKLGYDKYQLISGERRLKAAKMAGMTEIPTYIRVANDHQMLEMILVENLQREDLNPIEIAIGFQRLIEECNITQEQLSEKVGKNRSTIANYIRLLRLPPDIQVAIRDNHITMGHARALINLEDPESQSYLVRIIIDKDLSVREVEKIVRDLHIQPMQKIRKSSAPLPLKYQKIREELSEKLSAVVEIKRNNKGKGSIVIPFSNDEDLHRITSIFEK